MLPILQKRCNDDDEQNSSLEKKSMPMPPPPPLMKAATIFFGNCGYVQIGYHPDLSDNNLSFHLRVVIAVNGSYMFLKTEEVHNLFIFLRKQDEFKHVDGVDPYLPNEDDTFMGNFFLTERQSKHLFWYINYQNKKEYEIIFPSIKMVEELLSMENIIDGYLFKKFLIREEDKLDLANEMNKNVFACKNVNHLQDLAANSNDAFTLELATNFYSFFCQYWHMVNKC